MAKYDAVIIGSGLGGLCTAYILAKHGMKVCVLEKTDKLEVLYKYTVEIKPFLKPACIISEVWMKVKTLTDTLSTSIS